MLIPQGWAGLRSFCLSAELQRKTEVTVLWVALAAEVHRHHHSRRSPLQVKIFIAKELWHHERRQKEDYMGERDPRERWEKEGWGWVSRDTSTYRLHQDGCSVPAGHLLGQATYGRFSKVADWDCF